MDELTSRTPSRDTQSTDGDANPCRYLVGPTDDRRAARADYLVFMKAEERRRRSYANHAVVERRVRRLRLPEEQTGVSPFHYGDPVVDPKIDYVDLQVPCRVQELAPTTETNEPDLRIDQTLRFALGMSTEFADTPASYELNIVPLQLTWVGRVRYWLMGLLSRRMLFLRVDTASTFDIEKQLCRIPGDLFPVLGCQPGNRLIIEGIAARKNTKERQVRRIRTLSLAAYEASDERIRLDSAQYHDFLNQAMIDDDGHEVQAARRAYTTLLDLPPIFLDRDARKLIGTNTLVTVRVRRDLRTVLYGYLGFGIALVAATVGLAQASPLRAAVSDWRVALELGVVAWTIALSLIVLRMRVEH